MPAPPPAFSRSTPMTDLIFIGVTVLWFGAAIAYAHWCGRI